MLALVGMREMEADGVSDPVRRLECVGAMEVGGQASGQAGGRQCGGWADSSVGRRGSLPSSVSAGLCCCGQPGALSPSFFLLAAEAPQSAVWVWRGAHAR